VSSSRKTARIHTTKYFAAAGLLAAATAGSVAIATSSSAATGSVDLGVTGSIFAGVTSAQGQEIPFGFTTTNHSGSASADVAVKFTITNGTAASGSDYVCPLISNHFDIDHDTSTCEPGTLSHGRTTMDGVIVTPVRAGTVTVKACVTGLGSTDPVPSNNCKTLSVKEV
jgi:Domain of unknown function DUF11